MAVHRIRGLNTGHSVIAVRLYTHLSILHSLAMQHSRRIGIYEWQVVEMEFYESYNCAVQHSIHHMQWQSALEAPRHKIQNSRRKTAPNMHDFWMPQSRVAVL